MHLGTRDPDDIPPAPRNHLGTCRQFYRRAYKRGAHMKTPMRAYLLTVGFGFAVAVSSSSPANAQRIVAETVAGSSSDTATIAVSLQSHRTDIASVGGDIRFNPDELSLLGCTISSAIGPGTTSGKDLGLHSIQPGAEKFLLFGVNATILPDGKLFTCDFVPIVSGSSVTFDGLSAANARGDSIPLSARGGRVVVRGRAGTSSTDVQLQTDSFQTAAAATELFQLGFPLKTGPSVDPWSAVISSVMDHLMSSSYTASGGVTSYTGEAGNVRPSFVTTVNSVDLYGFGSDVAPSFMVNGNYSGGGDKTRLFYDGHPGYDYSTASQNLTAVAAADGVTASRSCFGEVVIDHSNGYKTVYLHLDTLDPRVTDATGQYATGKTVTRGDAIGTVGGRGCSGTADAFPVHLHFEVRKAVNGIDVPVDPYGWEGVLAGKGSDPYRSTDIPGINVRLWEPRPVDWSSIPQPVVLSGRPFNLSWLVTDASTHTNLHFDSIEDVSVATCSSRTTCTSTQARSGKGQFSASVDAPVVTGPTAYYFAAHATIGGNNYYSPLARITVTPTIVGDLNNDGFVNALDLQLMVNVILETNTDPTVRARADLNGDSAVNALDLQRLVNIILGV
jgi:murein DD-endopeptidase MepM/ murein hydrolase activator NlpD